MDDNPAKLRREAEAFMASWLTKSSDVDLASSAAESLCTWDIPGPSDPLHWESVSSLSLDLKLKVPATSPFFSFNSSSYEADASNGSDGHVDERHLASHANSTDTLAATFPQLSMDNPGARDGIGVGAMRSTKCSRRFSDPEQSSRQCTRRTEVNDSKGCRRASDPAAAKEPKTCKRRVQPNHVRGSESRQFVSTDPSKTYLPHLRLGDTARLMDMIPISPLSDIEAKLFIQDFCFVLRSNGQYTYAIVADRDRESFRVVLGEEGSTKVLRREYWDSSIRLVNHQTARRGWRK